MNILDLTEKAIEKVNLGVPFSIYRGHKIGDPNEPHVYITLADIPDDFLPASPTSYSWIDFAHSLEEGIVHSPYINLLSEHRNGEISRKLNQVMEEIGRQMGLKSIRAYNIVNQKLRRLLPRFGYTEQGEDSRGGYFEKKL